jgi:transposase InsO family protein
VVSDAIASRPEVLVVNAKPRLSPWSRLLLVERVLAGRPAAHVAAEMGISRATAYKWLARYRAEGPAGLADRSSRPHASPTRTDPATEAAILALRRDRRLGPARIAGVLGLHASTVGRVLARHHTPKLAWLDRPSGAVIRRPRRYEHPAPGDLVHVDVKKLGRLREGGGWRMLGHEHAQSRANHAAQSAGRSIGYEYLHVAVDDHSRLAYVEVLPDEQAATAVAFWARAASWLSEHGIHPHRVLTDNGAAYRSHAWTTALTATGTTAKRTRPYRPQTNGKVERFNRTMAEECLYAATYTSSDQRRQALADWVHTYNHHRAHTAIGGQPPITRLNDLPGHYS